MENYILSHLLHFRYCICWILDHCINFESYGTMMSVRTQISVQFVMYLLNHKPPSSETRPTNRCSMASVRFGNI